MERASQSVERNKTKKRIRWGKVSVLEFRVGYNASTVPESGGPPVGLIGQPIRHSFSLISVVNDVASIDSECDRIESYAALSSKETTLGYCRRSRNDLWLDPLERVRILAEQCAFPVEDIALICSDVRATLESRAFSRLDEVADETLRAFRVQPIVYRDDICSSITPKVLLYRAAPNMSEI